MVAGSPPERVIAKSATARLTSRPGYCRQTGSTGGHSPPTSRAVIW